MWKCHGRIRQKSELAEMAGLLFFSIKLVVVRLAVFQYNIIVDGILELEMVT